MNLSLRVASPGDDGDVVQSIADVSSAVAQPSIDQRVMSAAGLAAEAAVVAALPVARPPPVVIPAPPLPPAPVTVAEPVLAIAEGAAGLTRQPASASTPTTRAPPAVVERRIETAHAVAHASARVVQKRGTVIVESEVLARTLVVQRRSVRRDERRSKTTTAEARAHSTLRPPRAPRAPRAPFAPVSSGAAGAAGHGDGGSPLTGALAAVVAIVGLTFLCSVVSGQVPVRRRLSDDRRARPG